jgi:hypothetical protein
MGACSRWFRLLICKLVLLWFVQGSLFPLTDYVYPYVLLVSSLYCKLVLLFLIYTILTFDQKKKVFINLHFHTHTLTYAYGLYIALLYYFCSFVKGNN